MSQAPDEIANHPSISAVPYNVDIYEIQEKGLQRLATDVSSHIAQKLFRDAGVVISGRRFNGLKRMINSHLGNIRIYGFMLVPHRGDTGGHKKIRRFVMTESRDFFSYE